VPPDETSAWQFPDLGRSAADYPSTLAGSAVDVRYEKGARDRAARDCRVFLLSPPVPHMPQYLIERNIPGAGKLSADELKAISQKSCGVLSGLGPQIQWVHSYVTDDQIHCIYRAPNEEMVREHARQGGFPADRVSEIRTVIDPTTAE
jgi:hypothetical protein